MAVKSLEPISVNELLGICEYPLDLVCQVMRWSALDQGPGELRQASGGTEPIVLFEFSRGSEVMAQILFAAPEGRIEARKISGSAPLESGIREFIQSLSIGSEDEPEPCIGLFHLDCVVFPVPDWFEHGITKAVVVTQVEKSSGSELLVGFVVWLNVGIRLGMFVAFLPGIRLSFNDTCDIILAQARVAEAQGNVRIYERDFPEKVTKGQVSTIQWFE